MLRDWLLALADVAGAGAGAEEKALWWWKSGCVGDRRLKALRDDGGGAAPAA